MIELNLSPDYARKQRERFVIAMVHSGFAKDLSIPAMFDIAEAFIEESERRYTADMARYGITIKSGRRMGTDRATLAGTSSDRREKTHSTETTNECEIVAEKPEGHRGREGSAELRTVG